MVQRGIARGHTVQYLLREIHFFVKNRSAKTFLVQAIAECIKFCKAD